MTVEQIKNTANEYADLFLSSEDEFYKRQQADIDTYTDAENIIIIQLANLYYSCKHGDMDRASALERQKEILCCQKIGADGDE